MRTPTIDLPAGRAALLEAIQATNSSGRLAPDQTESIIKRVLVLGGAPRNEYDMASQLSGGDVNEVLRRPWVWLAANTSHAHLNGDHEFVAFSAFWVHMWKNMLYPKFGNYEHLTYMTSDVPPETVAEISALAQSSLALLPADYVLFGNESGQITAGWLGEHVGLLLG